MANQFTYHMIIRGQNNNIETLINALKSNNIPKINEVIIHDAVTSNNHKSTTLSGSGQWSAHRALLDNYDFNNINHYTNTKDTYLLSISKRLNVDIELYTEEPILGFEEYILISSGLIKSYQIKDMELYETNDYKHVNEFIKETQHHISEAEFNQNDVIKVGGFKDDAEFTLTLNKI